MMATKYTSRTKIKVEGMEELQKNVDRLKKSVFDCLSEAALDGAEIIKNASVAKAPVREGLLRQGIKAEVTWDRSGAPVAWAGAGFDKAMNDVFVKYTKAGTRYYYPTAVEYGHVGPHPAPANPFMRPALDENRAKARTAIRNQVKKAIEGAVK